MAASICSVKRISEDGMLVQESVTINFFKPNKQKKNKILYLEKLHLKRLLAIRDAKKILAFIDFLWQRIHKSLTASEYKWETFLL